MRKLTYAQNAEDVLLHRAFPTGTGFYIDADRTATRSSTR